MGDSVSAECSRVLELPQAFRYKVRFDRIPAYDLHAKGFFVNMVRSGLVALLADDGEDSIDTAYLETAEPIDGEIFRISVDEFVAYVHKDGHIEDREERESFLYEAMSAYDVLVEPRDKSEFDEVNAVIVSEANFDTFFPEAMPAAGGSESGFPTVAYFRGSPLTDELQMEIFPDLFRDLSRITVLHLMMHAVDTFNQEGWEIPEDTVLVIQKRPFVRAGSVTVPFRLIRESVVRAIERTYPTYLEIPDEEERLRKFFARYLLVEMTA